MIERTTYETIDEYIAAAPPELTERLNTLRDLIKRLAPEAEERMSWKMPTFCLNGNLVHFAAQKHHIGFYPGASGVEHFQGELEGYKTSKGAIQLPNIQPLPLDLIEKIVRFRVKENTSQQLGR